MCLFLGLCCHAAAAQIQVLNIFFQEIKRALYLHNLSIPQIFFLPSACCCCILGDRYRISKKSIICSSSNSSRNSSSNSPTNNALLINFQLSSDAKILLLSTDWAYKSAPNATCMYSDRACILHITVGGWVVPRHKRTRTSHQKCASLSSLLYFFLERRVELNVSSSVSGLLLVFVVVLYYRFGGAHPTNKSGMQDGSSVGEYWVAYVFVHAQNLGVNFASESRGTNISELSWNLLRGRCWLGRYVNLSSKDFTPSYFYYFSLKKANNKLRLFLFKLFSLFHSFLGKSFIYLFIFLNFFDQTLAKKKFHVFSIHTTHPNFCDPRRLRRGGKKKKTILIFLSISYETTNSH